MKRTFMLFPLRFISTSLKQLSLDDIIMVAAPPLILGGT